MDWLAFATPTLNTKMMFKKEIMQEVLHLTWEEYYATKDEKVCVPVLLQITNDFPDLKDAFNNYYETVEGGVWSDKTTVLRFFNKLALVYENREVQTRKV